MSSVQPGCSTIAQELGGEAFARVVTDLSGRRAARTSGTECLEHGLGCVWSGYSDGVCCHSRIPVSVVTRAWQAELEATGDREARFFHLIWQGGVWLAYGLENGTVRGVYCPSHNSERAERSHAALCGPGGDLIDLPLAA
jgi:hypothetical protein